MPDVYNLKVVRPGNKNLKNRGAGRYLFVPGDNNLKIVRPGHIIAVPDVYILKMVFLNFS